MSPDSPKDPFEGFDWSKQDRLNPQSSPPENPTPPDSPSDPTPSATPSSYSQRAYPPSQAPSPGTYYSNSHALYPSGNLAGTLTAFMIMEWIVFGFGIFGLCTSLPGIFVGGTTFGSTWLFYYAFSLLIGLASITFAFLSAFSIVKRKKIGITYGWIQLGISWTSIVLSSIFTFFLLESIDDSLGTTQSNTSINALSSGISLGCGIIFPLAMTILLALPSTKESADRELS